MSDIASLDPDTRAFALRSAHCELERCCGDWAETRSTTNAMCSGQSTKVVLWARLIGKSGAPQGESRPPPDQEGRQRHGRCGEQCEHDASRRGCVVKHEAASQ